MSSIIGTKSSVLAIKVFNLFNSVLKSLELDCSVFSVVAVVAVAILLTYSIKKYLSIPVKSSPKSLTALSCFGSFILRF